ncbi:MAG: hypothetical protein A3H51_00915 [Candidatus Spechtbacteria bacterium RIFCSPLOWO2_02_FULL_38_8]|uniref:Histidine--tRNA ligase n=1 Tax=Candidatus Spechtbacteria bacterium RIFCSPLOWO2_02_FULL_38_8 TaxID=1802164 RepID=A0A1G2HKB0_9BACT|nr:MAG: hypothetical protein A3H51_00915 [Candidatus Spechtbacteria bacterium RIFCSPLOWO2_02_FULL_38_8]
MHDILPQDQYLWDYFYRLAEGIVSFYNFGRIDTPILEFTEIFEKGTGQATDIVEKEMYTLRTRGGDRLTLRPEGTPPVVRAYIQHGMRKWALPVKLYYAGPMFRHDKPQRGRFRQFYQFGLEILGEKEPARDIEIIHITHTIFDKLKLKNIVVEINSIGCKQCRPKYVRKLKEHYRYKLKQVCKNCRDRYKTSPLKLLDCEDEKCNRAKVEAPHVVDYLCNDCSSHFKSVLDSLDYIDVPYLLNPYLVRGLDYYTKTVFEFFEDDALGDGDDKKDSDKNEIKNRTDIKAQLQKRLAIASGGRYDALVKTLGGQDTPGVGVAIGVDRVLEVMRKQGKQPSKPKEPRVFLVQLGDRAKKKAFRLIEEFRKVNIPVREALGRDSISAQLKFANKLGVDMAIIIGQKEALDNIAIIRDMKSGSQEVVSEEKLVIEIRKRLK